MLFSKFVFQKQLYPVDKTEQVEGQLSAVGCKDRLSVENYRIEMMPSVSVKRDLLREYVSLDQSFGISLWRQFGDPIHFQGFPIFLAAVLGRSVDSIFPPENGPSALCTVLSDAYGGKWMPLEVSLQIIGKIQFEPLFPVSYDGGKQVIQAFVVDERTVHKRLSLEQGSVEGPLRKGGMGFVQTDRMALMAFGHHQYVALVFEHEGIRQVKRFFEDRYRFRPFGQVFRLGHADHGPPCGYLLFEEQVQRLAVDK